MPDPANPPSPSPTAEPSAPGSATARPPPKPARTTAPTGSVLVTVHGPAGSSPAARRRLAEIVARAAAGLLRPRPE